LEKTTGWCPAVSVESGRVLEAGLTEAGLRTNTIPFTSLATPIPQASFAWQLPRGVRAPGRRLPVGTIRAAPAGRSLREAGHQPYDLMTYRNSSRGHRRARDCRWSRPPGVAAAVLGPG